MSEPRDDLLVWIDLEMTGLDPDRDRIIEIACVITDSQLEEVAEGPVMAVHQTDAALAAMDEWCTTQHGKSGLTARVQASRYGVEDAQSLTLEFLRKWVVPGSSPLCGNSIGQDRRFLYRYMPELERFFHYRSVDVSTIKELARRWSPNVVSSFSKSGEHLALADIRESIAELRHYRQFMGTLAGLEQAQRS